ncbi:MAG: YdbH domain-containing protein [Rhodospirillaceae bacterium]|nr:YdbH domain-containing protein [Rhodospirillaceae bacterium]
MRWWHWPVLGIGVVSAAGVGAWLVVGPNLVRPAVMLALESAGLPVDRARVAAIGFGSATLTDVSLSGGALVADSVSVTFDPVALANEGLVDDLTIVGAHGSMAVDAAGVLSIGGLDFGEDEDSAGGGLDLPFARLHLTDATVAFTSPWLSADLVGDVEIGAVGTAAATAIAGDATATTAWGTFQLQPDLQIAADGTLSGGVMARGDRVTLAGDAWADGVVAWVEVASDIDGDLTGQVTARAATFGTWRAADLVVTADLAGWLPQWLSVRGQAEPGGLDIALEAVPDATATADGSATWHVVGDVTADRLAALADTLGVGLVASGRGAVEADLSVTLPAPPDALDLVQLDLLAIPVAGTVALGAVDVALAGGGHVDAASLAGTIDWADNRLVVTGSRPWTIHGAPPDWGPVAATLGPTIDGPPHRITLQLDGNGALDAVGMLSIAGTSGAGDGYVQVSLTDIFGPSLFVNLPEARLDAFHFTLGDVAITLDGPVTVAAGGTPQEGELSLSGPIRVTPLGLDELQTLTADIDVDLSLRDGTLVALVNACRSVVAELGEGLGVTLDGPVETCVVPSDQPVARLEPDGTWTIDAAMAPLHATGELAGERFDLAAAGPPVAVTAGPAGVLVAGEGLDLVLPGAGVALSGAEIAVSHGEPGSGVTVDLEGGILRLLQYPAPVVPLWVAGTANFAPDGTITAQINGAGANGALRLSAAARGTGDGGRIDLRVAPIQFSADGVQPASLFPMVPADLLLAVEGRVSGSAVTGWGAGAAEWGEVAVDDLSVAVPGLTAYGLNGRFSVAAFDPLTVPPGQVLTAEEIDTAILLRNGRLVFGIHGGDTLSVEDLHFTWAGGVLSADPFETGLYDDERVIALSAEGVSLAEVLAMIGDPDLDADGDLAGRVPLRLSDDTIAIQGGLLAATRPGVIRYRPAEPPLPADEQGVDLLLEALEDFHYDGLSLSLAGQTGQDLTVALRLRGNNPALYDGYPIAVNLSVTGALDQLLEQGLFSANLADDLGMRFEQPDRDPRADLLDALRRGR